MALRIFFSLFNTLIFIYFLKYETIDTHARAFLTLIILAIAGVTYLTARLMHNDGPIMALVMNGLYSISIQFTLLN